MGADENWDQAYVDRCYYGAEPICSAQDEDVLSFAQMVAEYQALHRKMMDALDALDPAWLQKGPARVIAWAVSCVYDGP